MLRSPNFKIIKYRKFAYILSALIIIAGAANIAIHKGLELGIDFAGGNVLRVEIKEKDVEIGKVRDVLVSTGYGNNVQKIDDPVKNIYLLRTRAY